jgi:uncharacterized membrane protein YhaH (DUF805 family)
MDEKPQEADFYPPAEDYGIANPGKSSRESAAWYYTTGGNRQGPVGYSALRELARTGGLNPRHDMVWTKGMADWAPSGEVDGLFERVIIAQPEEEKAGAEDPYIPPEDLLEPEARREVWPGTNRRSYLFITFLFPILFGVGLGAATPFLSKELTPSQMGIVQMVGLVLPALLAFFANIGRLANVGMSRWWIFGNLIPILNVWLGYRTFACPAGYAKTKKLDGPGVLLAIIYWLFILTILLAIVGVILLAAGTVGDPELQQKLREFLQQLPNPPAK